VCFVAQHTEKASVKRNTGSDMGDILIEDFIMVAILCLDSFDSESDTSKWGVDGVLTIAIQCRSQCKTKKVLNWGQSTAVRNTKICDLLNGLIFKGYIIAIVYS